MHSPRSEYNYHDTFDEESEVVGKPIYTNKPKLDYNELEDQYLKLKEENRSLKKNTNQQDDKIKKMATKLARIDTDLKKKEEVTRGPRRRDIETENLVEDLRSQLQESQRNNEKLNNKAQYYKMMASGSQTKKPTRYGNVQSRVETGVSKKLVPSFSPTKMSSSMGRSISRPATREAFMESDAHEFESSGRSPEQLYGIVMSNPGYNLSTEDHQSLQMLVQLLSRKILEGNHEQNRLRMELDRAQQDQATLNELNSSKLDQEVRRMELQMEQMKRENESLKNENFNLKSTTTPRGHKDQLNNELLNLQKELREKTAKMNTLQSQLDHTEATLNTLRDNHSKLIEQSTILTDAFKEEKRKSLQLEHELKNIGVNKTAIKEKELMIDDLKHEKKIIEDAYNKLRNTIHTDFQEKESSFERERTQYKNTIKDLESRNKRLEEDSLNPMKDTLQKTMEKLETARTENAQIRTEKGELQVQLFQAQQKIEDLNGKLTFFTSESGVEISEIQQALTYVKLKKSLPLDTTQSEKDKKEIDDLRLTNAELIQENNKLQKLLQLEKNVTEDYKKMHLDSKSEAERVRVEYEHRLEDEARLLDIKSDRIRKLETQLNNYIYKRIKMDDTENNLEEVVAEEESVDLRDNENVVEIHIISATLTAPGFRTEVETFLTLDFYDFATSVSPVITGLRPLYNYSSRYVVTMEDFLFYYLKYQTAFVELHQCFGLDYNSLASCYVNLRELLEKNGKIFATAELISTADNVTVIGSLQYSLRFWNSAEEAIKVFKTKQQALSLMQSVDGSERYQRQVQTLERNELIITVGSCAKLKPAFEGKIPSVYVVYQFSEYPEQDTKIVNSIDPVFNETQTFTIPVTSELEEYLLTQKLIFAVFDDNEDKGFYFGTAEVALAPLVSDKMIQGTFSIKQLNGTINGTINVELYWKKPYKKVSMISSRQSRLPPEPKQDPPPVVSEVKPPPTPTNVKPVELLEEQFALDDTPEPKQLARKLSRTPSKPKPVELLEERYELEATPEPKQMARKPPRKPPVTMEEDPEATPPLTRRSNSVAALETPRSTKSTPRKLKQTTSESLMTLSELKPKRPATADSPMKRATNATSALEDSPSKNAIFIVVERLELDQMMLNSPAIESIFVGYEFLRYPLDQLETPALPKTSSGRFLFNFKKKFPLKPNMYRLATILTSDKRSDADIIFDVMYEKGIPGSNSVQCLQLATAEFNLHLLLEMNRDMEHEELPVRDRNDIEVGSLTVSIYALSALREVISAIRSN